MADPTVKDLEITINAKTDAILKAIAAIQGGTGGSTDLSPVMAALTGLQNTANVILAQDSPTPLPVPPVAQVPVITAVSPSTGTITGGEVVTLTGSNFTGATGVMFGTVAGLNPTVVSDTSMTVTSPAQPAAVVDVTVVDAAGTSAVSANSKYTLA